MSTVPGEQRTMRVQVRDVLHYLQNRPAYQRQVKRPGYADHIIALGASKGVNYGRTKRARKKK